MDGRKFHRFARERLRNKDFIFAELIDVAQKINVFFVYHYSLPGSRYWAVQNMKGIIKVISVPLETLLINTDDRNDLFRQEFEFAHELGHIVVFNTEDLTGYLNCSFIRLFPQIKCPYIELRAFEEGIKIMEDILEKYDKETKSEQKVKKFFRKIYLSPEYRANFSSECVAVLAEDKFVLKEEADFCPMNSQLKSVLIRID